MKHLSLIIFFTSSFLFGSQQPPSLPKRLKQLILGKYLITKARENNYPQVAALLEALRPCLSQAIKNRNIQKFIDESPFNSILQLDPEIAKIIRGAYLYKHHGPFNESDYATALVKIETRIQWNAVLQSPTRPHNNRGIEDSILQQNASIEALVASRSLTDLLNIAERKIVDAQTRIVDSQRRIVDSQ